MRPGLFQRILVPTDGSVGARHALESAAEVAALTGGELVALHVVAPPVAEVSYMGLGVIGAPVPIEPCADVVPPERDPALLEAWCIAGKAGVAISRHQVVAPQTANAILEVAEAQHCDLIVMATDGYGNLLSLITGSTAASVVAGCDLPVLLVH